jgi:23S rRNA (adenine-N6)-dimethyltransferase
MNLSQNFIKSSQLVKELISFSDLSSTDLIIEIGPGRGVITQELLKLNLNVVAVEKDRDLISSLRNKFSSNSNLKLINQDFLSWNLPTEPFKIFSNIPFSITAKGDTAVFTSLSFTIISYTP